MKRFKVAAVDAGMRLDVLLVKKLKITRTLAQRIAKNGATVNGKPATPHTAVKAGDVVMYAVADDIVEQKKVTPPIDILFEDHDLLIVNKPAGLLVHPTGAKRPETTLVDCIRAHFPGIDNVGDDPKRPGIVHRLDRDVSGVMVIAKTQAMFDDLKKQFANREVEKEYLALVYGKLPKDHDLISFRIARSKSRGRMVARPDAQEGKEAATAYDVLERFKTTTYVRVRIFTGRTHQIRAHFKGIGHPVVGDKVYKRNYMKNIRPIPLPRLFLHSTKLTVTLADGSKKTVETSLPDELKIILKTLPKP